MTGQCRGEVTGIDYISRRGFAYDTDNGMYAEIINGMDVLAVRDAVTRALEICRDGRGPVLLEAITYRFKGHSLSDPRRYRSRAEVEAWEKEDSIARIEKNLIKNNLLTEQKVAEEREQITENMKRLTEWPQNLQIRKQRQFLKACFHILQVIIFPQT